MSLLQYYVGMALIGATVGALLGGTSLPWWGVIPSWLLALGAWTTTYQRSRAD